MARADQRLGRNFFFLFRAVTLACVGAFLPCVPKSASAMARYGDLLWREAHRVLVLGKERVFRSRSERSRLYHTPKSKLLLSIEHQVKPGANGH
jgi:hypothetical protein